MNTLIQKIIAFFSTTSEEDSEAPSTNQTFSAMPVASPEYLREFAHRIGLEVDDLSPAEQRELKAQLDSSMDFREENYTSLYHQVYQLGHGYSLADAGRVSAQINEISADAYARAFLNYRENAVAAEALMAAGSLLREEGSAVAAERLFALAEVRRHRSSLLENHVPEVPIPETPAQEAPVVFVVSPTTEALTMVDLEDDGISPGSEASTPGLKGLMDSPSPSNKETK